MNERKKKMFEFWGFFIFQNSRSDTHTHTHTVFVVWQPKFYEWLPKWLFLFDNRSVLMGCQAAGEAGARLFFNVLRAFSIFFPTKLGVRAEKQWNNNNEKQNTRKKKLRKKNIENNNNHPRPPHRRPAITFWYT